jgi:hypothetical protein
MIEAQGGPKKKFKARSLKKILKSENTIFSYGDGATWDIKSDSDPEKVYMVYRSEHEGWLCDCMWFIIHENPSPPHPSCKHIKRVQKSLGK